jgi:prevent-host-death family protein
MLLARVRGNPTLCPAPSLMFGSPRLSSAAGCATRIDESLGRPSAGYAWLPGWWFVPVRALIGAARGLTRIRDLAILLAMTLSEHLSLADVKNRLSEVVDKLEREHGRVVVTKHGQPAAVMLNVDDLESLEETLAILSKPTLRDAVLEGADDVAAGRTQRLSREQALARIAKQ